MQDELLERYLMDGKPRIFDRVVEQYRPLVYSVCRRYLRDPADVDDAAQETFLKFSRSLEDIHGHVAGWLTSAAYTTCLNLIRGSTRERRRRQMLGRMGRVNDRCLLHEAIARRLPEALLQLDTPSCQLITWRFFEKKPLRVIAGESDASVATVGRRVQAALADLAAVLRDMGIESVDDLTLAGHLEDSPSQVDAEGQGLRFAADWGTTVLAPPERNPLSPGLRLLPGWKRPIRVGVFLSYESTTVTVTRDFRQPVEGQVQTTRLLRAPGLQLVGIVEPGTSGLGSIERTLRDYELLGGLIEATDVPSLKTLDVILFPNNLAVSDAVAASLVEAVESGIGLLKEYWCGHMEGTHADPYARKLLLADSPIYSFHMPHHCGQFMRAVVNVEHPLLPGLQPGMSFQMTGCGPIYHVVPGASVLITKDRWVMPEEHGIVGVGKLRPPAYIVGRLGRGRAVVIHAGDHVAWARRLGLGGDYFTRLLMWLAEPHRGA